MQTYKATMQTIYYEASEMDTWDCELKVDGENIVVSYQDDDGGYTLYKGKSLGEGHFAVNCPELRAKGTLHRFPDSKIFEGYWHEEGTEGMWRIIIHP